MSQDHLTGSACIGDQACTNLAQLLNEAAARIQLIDRRTRQHVVRSPRLLGTSDPADVPPVVKPFRHYGPS